MYTSLPGAEASMEAVEMSRCLHGPLYSLIECYKVSVTVFSSQIYPVIVLLKREKPDSDGSETKHGAE